MRLVMIGLPEKEKDEDGGNDIDSLACVKSACTSLRIDPDVVVETHRHGTVGEKPRIMKITFTDSSARRKFLTGFRDARAGLQHMSTAWVRPDLTFLQRQKDRELRDLLDIEKDKGRDVIIRNGEIIDRPKKRVSESVN